ncbi:MAG: redoxin domain-containing protein [Halobacteriaceae archaeon]
MSVSVTDFELPNAGPREDPLTLSSLLEDPEVDSVVLLFTSDYFAGHCWRYVKSLVPRYQEFRRWDAEVVVVTPEPRERVASKADAYDAPFPMVADPDHEVCEAYGQPVKFGALGRLHDAIGRMPATYVVDARGDPNFVYLNQGDQHGDYPDVDVLLEQVREVHEDGRR